MEGSVPPLFGGGIREVAAHAALGAAQGTAAGAVGGGLVGGAVWALRGGGGARLPALVAGYGRRWAAGGLVAGALLGSNLTPGAGATRGERAVHTGFVMSALGAAAVALSATGRGGVVPRLRAGTAGLLGGGAAGAIGGALGMPQHFVLVRERQ